LHYILTPINKTTCPAISPASVRCKALTQQILLQQDMIMSSTIEDLTINYEEDGIQVVKETGKEVLSKGAWTTILYRFQNLDRKTGEFGKDMFTIRRYQKRQGEYVMKSKFNISSSEQAKKIIEILEKWTSEN
jgi:hypothetical protein